MRYPGNIAPQIPRGLVPAKKMQAEAQLTPLGVATMMVSTGNG